MKYYKIDIKSHFPELGRIASSAEGKNIANADEYFWAMNRGEILYNTPIFDYFVLESFDKEKYWEWALFDVHDFIGEGSQIFGWYISDKLKMILEKFRIAPKYHFYETRLLYKEEKFKYWIFQFIASYRRLNKMQFVNFSQSIFHANNENYVFNSYEDWSDKNDEIYDECKEKLILKKVVLTESFDFFPLIPISSDIIVSENLKQAIEENGIVGFEFFEIDYEVVAE